MKKWMLILALILQGFMPAHLVAALNWSFWPSWRTESSVHDNAKLNETPYNTAATNAITAIAAIKNETNRQQAAHGAQKYGWYALTAMTIAGLSYAICRPECPPYKGFLYPNGHIPALGIAICCASKSIYDWFQAQAYTQHDIAQERTKLTTARSEIDKLELTNCEQAHLSVLASKANEYWLN